MHKTIIAITAIFAITTSHAASADDSHESAELRLQRCQKANRNLQKRVKNSLWKVAYKQLLKKNAKLKAKNKKLKQKIERLEYRNDDLRYKNRKLRSSRSARRLLKMNKNLRRKLKKALSQVSGLKVQVRNERKYALIYKIMYKREQRKLKSCRKSK